MAQNILAETGLTVQERPFRSVIKTLTWRVTGSGATFLISWFISGSWSVAGSIAVIQIVANTLLYYLHERVWNFVTWGRINTPAKEIDP